MSRLHCIIDKDSELVRLLPETEVPSFDTYFCYPDAMKNQAKLHAFRDFVIAKARNWQFRSPAKCLANGPPALPRSAR